MPLPSQLSKRFTKLDGRTATLRTFTENGTDKYGDTKFDSTDTEVKVVKGFGTNTRMPERLHTEMGDSRPMDYEFIIRTSEAPDQSENTGQLPRIILENRTFRILEVEDMRIGISRLLCESLRTHKGAP